MTLFLLSISKEGDLLVPNLNENNIRKLETEGKTVMILAQKKQLVGFIAVMDTIKKNSIDAIKEFKKLGLKYVYRVYRRSISRIK